MTLDPRAATIARDGFAVAGRLCDGEALAAARDAAGALLDRSGVASQYGRIAMDGWRRVEPLRALLPRLAALVRAAFGVDEVRVFHDLVIAKPPGHADWLPYHQDQTSVPLDCHAMVAWVALDDADVANGCLHYVPGTHALGLRRPAAFAGVTLSPEATARPPMDVDGREVVAAPVAAGEALVHTSLVWHGSPGNTTERPRRGWSVWFVPPDARWAPDRAPHPYVHELAPVAGAPVEGERFPAYL